MRVSAYIDGYNLYHALDKHACNYQKWLDLSALTRAFLPSQSGILAEVHYFSAYAHWKPTQMQRHRLYVAALEAQGVKCHMARFSNQTKTCQNCNVSWIKHEEKETDVRIATHLLKDGIQDKYDRALIVSRDSDLVPAAEAFKELMPEKELFVVAPPNLGHSTEMLNICDGKRKIKVRQLDRFLLPEISVHPDGRQIIRPTVYDP